MFKKMVNRNKRGIEWIGKDGLLNFESAALIVIFMMIFFPVFWSVIFSLIIVLAKSAFDKSNGSENECRDIICAASGVIIGVLLGMAILI